ncbi:MAG: Rrf2 family transcriptional regulator [Chloroflexi bacterium]|nr:Rrf2 family transcriptional regulator [Chloroflexota bacterium]
MELTREADYAIRIMLEVASRPEGEPTTTTQIAQRRLAPRPFVRKIVRHLVAAGLLTSRRGAYGGLLLARPAGGINLLAIVEAVQGPISINRCVLRPDICPLQRTCAVYEVCQFAQSQLVGMLSRINLTALLQRSAELRAGDHHRPAEPLPASLGA